MKSNINKGIEEKKAKEKGKRIERKKKREDKRRKKGYKRRREKYSERKRGKESWIGRVIIHLIRFEGVEQMKVWKERKLLLSKIHISK